MKLRALVIILVIAALFAPLCRPAASGQEAPPNDVLRLLRYIPDTPDIRLNPVAYGDLVAWYTGWNVLRVPNLAMVDLLPRDPHAYWMFIMPKQVAPPEVLGLQYLLIDDLRGTYGFDLFGAERFIYTMNPPDEVSILEHTFDPAAVADRLIESGYESTALESGGSLYSLWDDYETVLSDLDVRDQWPRTGWLGALNRIALVDGRIVVGRATANVTRAVGASQGVIPSLADDPAYAAAAQAALDPALADTGELVGLIFSQALYVDDPMGPILNTSALNADQLESLIAQHAEGYTQAIPLYTLVGFATRHAPGATYNILAMVFPPGEDAAAAAETLGQRLAAYESLWESKTPFGERWALDRALAVNVDDLPVALVVMRQDDPPPAPDGERANTALLTWIDLIVTGDLGFLMVWESK